MNLNFQEGEEEEGDCQQEGLPCPIVCRHLLCAGLSGLQSLGRQGISDRGHCAKLGFVGVS